MADIECEVVGVIDLGGSPVLGRVPCAFDVAAVLTMPSPPPVAFSPLAVVVAGGMEFGGSALGALNPLAFTAGGSISFGGAGVASLAPLGASVAAALDLPATVEVVRQVGFEVAGEIGFDAVVDNGMVLGFEVAGELDLQAEIVAGLNPMAVVVSAVLVFPADVNVTIRGSLTPVLGQTLLLECAEGGDGTIAGMNERWRMTIQRDDATIELTGDEYPLED